MLQMEIMWLQLFDELISFNVKRLKNNNRGIKANSKEKFKRDCNEMHARKRKRLLAVKAVLL